MTLTLGQVHYIYGMGTGQECPALKNINLEVDRGEFIGLVGASGSGKSTLIQLLNGLERPTSGTVLFHGQDIWDKDFSRKSLRGKVGLMFQNPDHQLFGATVEEDVSFGPRNLDIDKLQIQLRTYKALEQVGLGEDLLDVSPLALSGGQKRRVALAGVLAMEPEILILDEPMAGLDPAGRQDVLCLLRKIHQDRGITIIIVSHSMDDVADFANRILVMNKGQIVLDGAPTEIFAYEKELKAIGLGVPQTTSVLHRLQEATGAPLTTALTTEECVDGIIDWLQA